MHACQESVLVVCLFLFCLFFLRAFSFVSLQEHVIVATTLVRDRPGLSVRIENEPQDGGRVARICVYQDWE